VSFCAFGSSDRSAFGALVRSPMLSASSVSTEAHPVAIMESLATGVRAVVAATSGLSELARHGWAVSVSHRCHSYARSRAPSLPKRRRTRHGVRPPAANRGMGVSTRWSASIERSSRAHPDALPVSIRRLSAVKNNTYVVSQSK